MFPEISSNSCKIITRFIFLQVLHKIHQTFFRNFVVNSVTKFFTKLHQIIKFFFKFSGNLTQNSKLYLKFAQFCTRFIQNFLRILKIPKIYLKLSQKLLIFFWNFSKYLKLIIFIPKSFLEIPTNFFENLVKISIKFYLKLLKF